MGCRENVLLIPLGRGKLGLGRILQVPMGRGCRTQAGWADSSKRHLPLPSDPGVPPAGRGARGAGHGQPQQTPRNRVPFAPPLPGRHGRDAILHGPCTSCRPGVTSRCVPGHVQLRASGTSLAPASLPWAPLQGPTGALLPGQAPHQLDQPLHQHCSSRYLCYAGDKHCQSCCVGQRVGAPSPRANQDEPWFIMADSLFSSSSPRVTHWLCFPVSPVCRCSLVPRCTAATADFTMEHRAEVAGHPGPGSGL